MISTLLVGSRVPIPKLPDPFLSTIGAVLLPIELSVLRTMSPFTPCTKLRVLLLSVSQRVMKG